MLSVKLPMIAKNTFLISRAYDYLHGLKIEGTFDSACIQTDKKIIVREWQNNSLLPFDEPLNIAGAVFWPLQLVVNSHNPVDVYAIVSIVANSIRNEIIKENNLVIEKWNGKIKETKNTNYVKL